MPVEGHADKTHSREETEEKKDNAADAAKNDAAGGTMPPAANEVAGGPASTVKKGTAGKDANAGEVEVPAAEGQAAGADAVQAGDISGSQ